MEWINIKIVLPELNHLVLVTDGKETYPAQLTCFLDEEKNEPVFSHIRNDLSINGITHWMPLPNPPEQEILKDE